MADETDPRSAFLASVYPTDLMLERWAKFDPEQADSGQLLAGVAGAGALTTADILRRAYGDKAQQ